MTLYSARVTKGGLLAEAMRSLILTFEPGIKRADFAARVRQVGALGASTGARQENLLSLFYQRYGSTVRSFEGLKALLEHLPPRSQALLLYFHAAEGDELLGDFVRDHLLPKFERGEVQITVEEAQAWVVGALAARGQAWNEAVSRKAAHSLLALLRDAGLLEGVYQKEIRHPYLPPEVAAYVVYHLRASGFTTGMRVREHPAWRLFLLRPMAVDQVLGRLSEAGHLQYAVAGSVYQLDYPYESVEEVSRALVHPGT